MPLPSKCWVCGRTGEEIQATLLSESQENGEYEKQLAQVAWFRGKLTESAALWRRSVPRDFKDMDFGFVVGNPNQFRSFTVINDINDARNVLMDWLVKASAALRKGDEEALQKLKLFALKPDDRRKILMSFEQFEGRWHRLLANNGGEAGRPNYPAGFERLGLGDGIEFLIAGGILYYDTQNLIIQFAHQAEESKKPRFGVTNVALRGFGPVPICDVCRGLVVGLRGAQEEVVERAEVEVAKQAQPPPQPAPQPIHKPQPVAPRVPQQPSKRVRTQEAVEEVPQQASEGYLDIVNKLKTSASAEDTAPKLRGLHEHRLKEDWDEVLEQQKAETQ